MMGMEPEIVRHDALERLLGFLRRLRDHQRQAVRDPENMGVDGDSRIPNAMLTTTLAVLRPTPGRVSRISTESGTSPPNSATRRCESAITFFAFVLKKLMVLIRSRTPLAERQHLRGRVRDGKKPRVALLTPASVACAESTTATRSV